MWSYIKCYSFEDRAGVEWKPKKYMGGTLGSPKTKYGKESLKIEIWRGPDQEKSFQCRVMGQRQKQNMGVPPPPPKNWGIQVPVRELGKISNPPPSGSQMEQPLFRKDWYCLFSIY